MATINVPEEEDNQEPLRGGAAGARSCSVSPLLGWPSILGASTCGETPCTSEQTSELLVHQAWSALRGAPRKAPPTAPKRRDPSNLRPAHFSRIGTVMIDQPVCRQAQTSKCPVAAGVCQCCSSRGLTGFTVFSFPDTLLDGTGPGGCGGNSHRAVGGNGQEAPAGANVPRSGAKTRPQVCGRQCLTSTGWLCSVVNHGSRSNLTVQHSLLQR